jgi:hypothetical protein
MRSFRTRIGGLLMLTVRSRMDAAKKKRLKTQWRDQQRKSAQAALPLSVTDLKAMFDMLDVELPQTGCDHTRRLTEAWLRSRGHDVESVFAWLDTQGGYCDCEVLANVEEKVDDESKA